MQYYRNSKILHISLISGGYFGKIYVTFLHFLIILELVDPNIVDIGPNFIKIGPEMQILAKVQGLSTEIAHCLVHRGYYYKRTKFISRDRGFYDLTDTYSTYL